MAVNINLVTFNGKTVTPKTDGIIQDAAIGQCGIFDGCTVTANGNTINIQGGYGIIRGRFFELDDSSISVTLPSASTVVGRLYLRLDLSNTSLPIQMLVSTATSRSRLPDLIQNDNANFENGIWDMELALFDITTTAIDNLEETYTTIENNSYQINELKSRIGSTRFAIASNVSSAQYPVAYGFYDASTKTVRVYFAARYSGTVASGTTMFTIPSQYRPLTSSDVVITVYSENNVPIVGYQGVTSNGKITQGLSGYCRAISGYGEYKLE